MLNTKLKAINLCYGEKNLGLAIKVSHYTIDAWLKDPSMITDPAIALKIEQATGVYYRTTNLFRQQN